MPNTTTPQKPGNPEEAIKAARSAAKQLDTFFGTERFGWPEALAEAVRAQQALLESIVKAMAPKPAPTVPPPSKCTPFSELVAFNLVKRLAERALAEYRERDPANRLVHEMAKRLENVTTPAELDELLADTCEDDWLEGFVRARSLELIEDLLGAIPADKEADVHV